HPALKFKPEELVPPYRQEVRTYFRQKFNVISQTEQKGHHHFCQASGCGQKVYRDQSGVERMGVPLSDVCFRKHQRMAELNVLLRPRPPNQQDPTPQPRPLTFEPANASTGSVNPPNQAVTHNNHLVNQNSNVAATSHSAMQSATAGPSGGVSTPEGHNSKLDSEFRFFDQHVLDVLLQATRFHFEEYMSKAACERFLADEKQKLARLGDRFGTLSKTLFRQWIQRATLKRLSGLHKRHLDEGAKTKIPSIPVQAEIYDNWLDHLNTFPPYASTKWVRDVQRGDQTNCKVLHSMVALQPSFRDAQKKSYTVEKAHPGNSYIHFLLEGSALFGSIQTIFTTDQIPNTTFAPVALFVEVEQKGTRIDPYRKISSLHYQLLTRPKTPKTIVICVKHVIGHVAVLTNVSGVFGLDTETISVAIVHHLYIPNRPYASTSLSVSLPGFDACLTSRLHGYTTWMFATLPTSAAFVSVLDDHPSRESPNDAVPAINPHQRSCARSLISTIFQIAVQSIPPDLS
ncbi:hypothetical protein MJO29_012857, partial [Puccinia striiformis f. sp. tritici]